MAKSSQTAEILLKYSIDNASANRVRQSFTALEYELSDLREELTGVGTAAQQGVANLRARFGQGETAIVSMQDEVEELRRDLLALDDVNVTPKVNMPGGGGADGLATVDRFGRFGTQFAGAFGASGSVGNVVGFVGDLADSVGTLGIAGGASAVAIGAVSLALAGLTAQAEETGRRLGLIAEGEAAGEELAAFGTLTDQIARRGEIVRAVALYEEQLAEREQERADLLRSMTPEQAANAQRAAEWNIILGEDAAAVEHYDNAISGLQDKITGLSAEYIELNARIAEAETPIRNLAGGMAALQPVYNLITGGIQRQIQAAQGLFATKDAVTSVLDFLRDGIAATADKAREAASQLRTEKADQYLASVTRTVQAQEALTKAQSAYDEAVRASGARIAEINTKLQADLSEAETERQNDLAEAAAKAGEDRVRITEEAEQERARIQQRFERSFAQAVGDRDALAAKRAEEQRDDESKQLDERYKDQLKAVDKALAQQNKVVEDRYRQQVNTINAAAQAAVRTEQQAAQARLSALQQGVQAAQIALVNAQQSEYLIRANYYNQSISQAQVWANQLQFLTSYAFGLTSGGGGGIGGRTMPTPLATGGPVVAGRSYVVGDGGRPELFVPKQNGYVFPSVGGMSVNINVTGAQTSTINALSRQQALNAFDGVLRQMGVA